MTTNFSTLSRISACHHPPTIRGALSMVNYEAVSDDAPYWVSHPRYGMAGGKSPRIRTVSNEACSAVEPGFRSHPLRLPWR